MSENSPIIICVSTSLSQLFLKASILLPGSIEPGLQASQLFLNFNRLSSVTYIFADIFANTVARVREMNRIPLDKFPCYKPSHICTP